MLRELRRVVGRFANKVRNQFIIGLIIMVPAVITIWVLGWIFSAVDSILQPVIRLIIGRYIMGIGFIITIALIYLTGVISTNVAGQGLIHFGETLLTRVPFVRPFYASVKEVVARFSEPGKNNILRVALVEYPRKGITSLALVTNEFSDKNGRKMLTLLIPVAPNPLSGFVTVVPEDEVIQTSIRPDTAMKMIVSCGALVPQEVRDRLSVNDQTIISPAPTSVEKRATVGNSVSKGTGDLNTPEEKH